MTIKQIQHLLAYLGYYTMKVDGISGAGTVSAVREFQQDFGITVDGNPGSETQKALRHAVAYGMPEKETGEHDFWATVPHFKQSEFACKCGCGFDDINHDLVRLAERVREYFGVPVTVSSGCRCKSHNASPNVGGVYNSRHLSGKAMDFCVRGIPSSIVLPYVQSLPGIRYAYAIDGSFVHMDVE